MEALSNIVASGQAILAAGGSALDAVTEAVRLLEECPLFNAGKGSVFTHNGTHELDACIMDGRTQNAGAVAGVARIRNPVLAARAVLENSPHVLLSGAGAEQFARTGAGAGGARFLLDRRALAAATARAGVAADAAGSRRRGASGPLDADRKLGTVGAVACDGEGNLPPPPRPAA